MIKKFIKPTKILLEEHKATFDIELNNKVYRDLKYTPLYYHDTGIAFESDKDSVIVKSTDDLMVKTSKKWIKRERKRLGEAKRKIRAIARDYNAPMMRQALEGMRVKPAVSCGFLPFKQKQKEWHQKLDDVVHGWHNYAEEDELSKMLQKKVL